MLSEVFKERVYDRESKSRKRGIDGTSFKPWTKIVLESDSKNHLLSTCAYKFWKTENITQSKNLGRQELMSGTPYRAHKWNWAQLLKTTCFNMLSQVFKGWDYDRGSKSRKSGIYGTRSTPCAQLALVKARKNHLLSTCSYKFSKSENITHSQNLLNQELLWDASHLAQN